MERTLYFNYTKPSQTQLNYTEDSKTRSIIKRQRSTAQMGIRTGFRISVNVADSTKIDIGPGEGYTGGFFEQQNLRAVNAGESISTLTSDVTGSGYSPTKVGQGLQSYSNGIRNFISLVYSESTSIPLAENKHPYYTEHDTIVSETYTVEALTETNWLLLTNDELENRVLVGIVTANGPGVPLTDASIEQFTQPNNHPIAGTLSLVTGITILSVSDDTVIGTGTLRWDPAINMLYWKAPGDNEGTGTLISSNSTYVLYSANVSYYLTVESIFSNMPLVATTEDLDIKSLYGRVIPMYSAIDQAHRDMIGTGKRSLTNPHGLSIADISGGILDHADLFHENGISFQATRSQLACTIDNNNIDITNLGDHDNSFLIDGITYDLINGVAALTDGTVAFDDPAPWTDGEYLVYLDSGANPQAIMTSDARFAADANFGGRMELVDIHNSTAGACVIYWDFDDKTLAFQGVDGVVGTAVPWHQTTVGTYYKLYSNDTTNWIIIYVDGNLNLIGVDQTLTFNTDLGEDVYPEHSMLKLCSVAWDQAGEVLDELHDLRRFNTADNRVALEEEHGIDGLHTKVLRNPFRVAVATNTAVFGTAANTGMCGIAATDHGVYGSAGNYYGVRGEASVYYGGYFRASSNFGAEAHAMSYGVAGLATAAAGDYGVYGFANRNYGVCGKALQNIGVYGTVSNVAAGYADNITAVYGKAYAGNVAAGSIAIGGKFEALNDQTAGNVIGVYGSVGAVGTGVMGFAHTAMRGIGSVDGAPFTAFGVWGSAANGVAANQAIAVYGTGATGVYCDGSLYLNQAPVGATITANSYIKIKLSGGAEATINVKV